MTKPVTYCVVDVNSPAGFQHPCSLLEKLNTGATRNNLIDGGTLERELSHIGPNALLSDHINIDGPINLGCSSPKEIDHDLGIGIEIPSSTPDEQLQEQLQERVAPILAR